MITSPTLDSVILLVGHSILQPRWLQKILEAPVPQSLFPLETLGWTKNWCKHTISTPHNLWYGPPYSYGEICSPLAHFELSQVVNPCLNWMWVCLKMGYTPAYSRWTKYSNPAALTMLNPRTPKSQCFSARVTKSDVRGLIFFRPLGLMHCRLH